MEASVRHLLARRRARAISTILGVKERRCDRYLPYEAQEDLRRVVLGQINDFHDLVFDLLKVFEDDGMVINDLFLERLDEKYDELIRAETEVADIRRQTDRSEARI